MALVSLQRGQAHSGVNYWNDVWLNDNEIVTQVNGNLDNSNIAAAASIAHSKLANTDAGKLLIANASGVITGTAMSGDVTISSTGVTTIGNDKVTADQLKDSADTDGDRAVTTNHVRDNAVTKPKVADDAIGSAELDLYTASVADTNGGYWSSSFGQNISGLSIASVPAGVYLASVYIRAGTESGGLSSTSIAESAFNVGGTNVSASPSADTGKFGEGSSVNQGISFTRIITVSASTTVYVTQSGAGGSYNYGEMTLFGVKS